MTSKKGIVLAITFSLAALLLAACGGSSSSSSSTTTTAATSQTVSADQYANSVCRSVADWISAIKIEANDLSNQVTSASSLKAARADLVAFLQRTVTSTDVLIARVNAAGTPDVAQAAQATTSLENAFRTIRAAFVDARNRAAALPTNDQAAFQQGATSISNSISTQAHEASRALQGAGIANGELNMAFSRSPACQQVNSLASSSS